MVLWISPWKLFKNEVFAGIVFILAFVAFALNLTIVGLRAYWFGCLSFGILLSLLWYTTMVFLLLDLLATLLMPSRDLQEGTVVAFGIISIMQIPLVTLFLLYELNPTNQLWLLMACIETEYAENCSSWLVNHKYLMVIPSTFSCAVHILILGFASWYIRHRAPTSAALLLDDELVYLNEKKKKDQEKQKKKQEKRKRKEQAKKEKREKDTRPYSTYYSGSGGSSSGSEGVDEGLSRSALDEKKNPDAFARSRGNVSDFGFDESDIENKGPGSGSPSIQQQQEKELGRRSGRGSASSRRSSRGY
ncbi:hypothetical protein JCM16303_001644 [Sporobolomyces ruberrimus]